MGRRTGQINFEVGRPRAVEAGPRMDVCGFVGFVRRGDARAAVTVESAAEFAHHFGPDAEVGGRSSQLGSSVRAFFQNGGQRAVVVGVPVDLGPSAAALWDPLLGHCTALSLRAEAFAQRDDAQVEPSPAAEGFRGIHALLDHEEVSLIAVPDATLMAGGAGKTTVTWTLGDTPPQAPTPHMTRPLFRPVTELIEPAAAITPTWDLTVKARLDDRPALLHWITKPDVPGLRFEVQSSPTPAFKLMETLVLGSTEHTLLVELPTTGTLCFRVRANDGPWSATLTYTAEQIPGSEAGTEEVEAIRALHTALLRLCAARGDTLGLLSLPQRATADEARTHVAEVLRPLGALEGQVASFGAVFHPWLLSVEAGRTLPCIPPDGLVAGLMAAHTQATGCWRSPANLRLSGLLGLADDTATKISRALAALGEGEPTINTLAATNRGVLLLSADTLSLDPDWRPLGVRRLMGLIRRLALRQGQVYVFETGGPALARTAATGFYAVLQDLFRQGALAGNVVHEAFEVAAWAGAPTGPRGTSLFVELRVAPSVPARFLHVRLLNNEAGGLATVGD